ncbi:MAG: class II fructose-bisphosphatase, partial [Coriobacteriia bacterium]|nr:class II fructose-bisphosphatase [Coriobacteriia bacterium]
MDTKIVMGFVEVAEKAAIAASKWRGLGKKNDADQAAVEAMRNAFNEMDFSGRIVIGEGERDEAPMLYIGEELGRGGIEIDIAVDPLEGTNLCAHNQPNALTTLALAPKGALLYAPDTYMNKIAAGPLAKGKIHIDKSVAENIQAVASAYNKPVSEVNVCVLDRERHEQIIKEVREAGARVRLISDGDVFGAIATALDGTGIDLYLGAGGAPEGVLAACGLKAIGGVFMGRFQFRNEDEIKRAKETSGVDIDGVLTMDDLVRSD